VIAVTKKLLVILVLALAPQAEAQEGLISGLKEAARANPKDAAAQTALGKALTRSGHFAQAEQQLKLAARLQGDSLASLYEVAEVQFAKGDHGGARRACQVLMKADAHAPLSLICMARAFLVWKRSSLAFDYLDQAGVNYPNDMERELALADAYRIKGDIAQSVKSYQAVIAKAPGDPRPYFGLGLLYSVFGPPQKTIESLQKALERDPEAPEIQLALGRELAVEVRGRQLLQKAVDGRPNWDTALIALGNSWLLSGDTAQAADLARKTLKLTPGSAEGHLLLGRALLAQNNFAGAEPSLLRAQKLVPNLPATALALAKMYTQTNRPEQAFESYRTAANLLPKDPTPLVDAARLAFSLTRKTLAAGFLELALERSPNHAPALALYGDVFVALGDKAKARQYYERSLKGDGEVDRSRIRELIKKL
jgi:tetratricopeptide (TPR) repeat protein